MRRLWANMLAGMAALWGGAASAQTGACCLASPAGIACHILTEALCAANGGVFHGVGSNCSNVLCGPVGQTGACAACCRRSAHSATS